MEIRPNVKYPDQTEAAIELSFHQANTQRFARSASQGRASAQCRSVILNPSTRKFKITDSFLCYDAGTPNRAVLRAAQAETRLAQPRCAAFPNRMDRLCSPYCRVI